MSQTVQPKLTGHFISGVYTHDCVADAGVMHYKLYMPKIPKVKAQRLALVVMLHGCTQNSEDFAMGTGMNDLAANQPCFVLYPEQSKESNKTLCWNWFEEKHQQRDQGEPAIIADLTRHVMAMHNIDPKRVYIAGLSAGGAMAAIMGAVYPDLYAAVGVCAGLPYKAAHDLNSAVAAMKNGASVLDKLHNTPPIIVFQGDNDQTVSLRNAEQLIEQYVSSSTTPFVPSCTKTGQVLVPNGRGYTQRIYKNSQDKIVAEHWVIHGADHAWPGGSAQGSYTDPAGPDASLEMLRFFKA